LGSRRGTVGAPPRSAFTARERALIGRLRTPLAVQRYLNQLPYNTEPAPQGATLRSFRGVVAEGCAHCLEATLFAAVVLEQHGYPPLVLSFESVDELDHVIFVYRDRGRWGSVARSRDPGLHGRRAVFATPRALALSYVDPYVDYTGRVKAYAVVDLRRLGEYDWRLASTNVWKVERMLLDFPHRPIRTSDARFRRLRARYRAYRAEHGGRKPIYYERRDRWTEIPEEFLRS
jgi:hypothetical protein